MWSSHCDLNLHLITESLMTESEHISGIYWPFGYPHLWNTQFFYLGWFFPYYGFYLFLIFWVYILSSYMYCKYLLPPFSFDSPCHVFWWTEAPNFNVVQYIFFNVLFFFSLTKSLAPPMSWKYSPILSSRSTIVSHLGLLTYNWFFNVWCEVGGSRVTFFYIDI